MMTTTSSQSIHGLSSGLGDSRAMPADPTPAIVDAGLRSKTSMDSTSWLSNSGGGSGEETDSSIETFHSENSRGQESFVSQATTIDGLIDDNGAFRRSSADDANIHIRMIDFVSVLEHNGVFTRRGCKRRGDGSGLSTSSSKQQKRKRKGGDSVDNSVAHSSSSLKGCSQKSNSSHSNSDVAYVATTQSFSSDARLSLSKVVEEKEQILALFRIGEETHEPLGPQHQALSRVVKHIFCQVDADLMDPDNLKGSQNTLSNKILKGVEYLVNHRWFSAFFMLLTIYMLFAQDFVLCFGDRELDGIFLNINTIICFLFLLELILCVLGHWRKYVLSVNILMDGMSLFSIMLDSILLHNFSMEREGTRVLTMARTPRMARLARLARVARVTRVIPRFLRLCAKQEVQLAKIVLFRRLWRIFCFLDTDNDHCVNSFDVRFLYLTIMQECTNITQPVLDRLGLLCIDVRWMIHQLATSDRHTLSFDEFVRIILGTGLGKTMVHHHQKDAAADRGVLSLTQALGESTAMKVCIGIIVFIGMLSFLEIERLDTSAEQGLAQLDGIARALHSANGSWNVNILCEQIRRYADQHKVEYIFLNGFTYWLNGRCLTTGIPETELDPVKHVERIIGDSSLRRSEFIKMPTCWRDCWSMSTSVALVDDSVRNRTDAMWGFITTFTLIFLLLLFVHILNMDGAQFSKTMLEPLRAISDDMTALACMDLVHIDQEIPSSGKYGDRVVKVAEELQQLQKAFQSMRSAVKYWSKYVPTSVVQRLFAAGTEAKIGVVRCNASILFCDIVGFEDICCGLPPKKVLELLRLVLEKVAEIVHRNRGTLLEFIGDEVLAAFNTPSRTKHHAFQALRSAYEAHNVVESLPPAQVRDGTSAKIRLRCGVNSANLLAGNLGSSQRMKYGVLGDGVNLTARLKGLNSRYKSHTLVTDETMKDPAIKRNFISRPVDLVAVKGKKEPTLVHEVLQPKPGQSRWMRSAALKHSEAYGLYLKRAFEEAKVLFEDVMEKFKDNGIVDEPSRLLWHRCIVHLKDPPPDDWDGVDRLTKKTFEAPGESAGDAQKKLSQLIGGCPDKFDKGELHSELSVYSI